jgi:hypothetical protein
MLQQTLQPSKGFLLVASISKAFYSAGVRLAVSIKDHYPDARITLYTHAAFVEDRDRYLFENVITGIPVHTRAKLYALDKSPYDITLYMDCDTEVWHKDIKDIFDLLGDNDISMTEIREYSGKGVSINKTEKMKYHGGLFLYRNNEKVKSFMRKWWQEYLIQVHSKTWPWPEYSEKMKPWDQFTFWRLCKEDTTGIKIATLPDDARWNFVYNYKESETDKPIVIHHYTIPKEKIHAGFIENSSGSPTDIR